MKHRTILVLFLLLCTLAWKQTYAQSRGPTPGVVYFSLAWHWNLETSKQYIIIINSDDYGRHLNLLYTYEEGSGEMPVGWVYADRTPNVLYNKTTEGLFRTLNDGAAWEQLDESIGTYVSIASGNVENEVFKVTSEGSLYKSIDNGDTWNLKHENMTSGVEVGTQIGELYTREVTEFIPLRIKIGYSMNDGVEFITYDVDTTITGLSFSGYMAGITRGAIEGEVYLVSWWYPANYKIFRSTDHGQSFTLQYEQPDTCYFWDEYYYFTAGRGEGEFYIFKGKSLVDGYYTRLHVFHSADYAQTFTEYVHDLREDYDGNPTSIIYTIAAAPNPLEGGTVEGGGKYHEGSLVTLTATPNEGYKFISWTEGGNVISEEPTLSFTAESTRTLVAQFQLINGITSPNGIGITLYPNPANGFVMVNFHMVQAYSNVVFEVFSIHGLMLLSKPINLEQSTLNISSLPTGMYLYRFTADGLTVKTGKLINQ